LDCGGNNSNGLKGMMSQREVGLGWGMHVFKAIPESQSTDQKGFGVSIQNCAFVGPAGGETGLRV